MMNKVVKTDKGAYIDGVPSIGFGEWHECTLSGCLMRMLGAIGIDATYEQLAGLTGSCYRTNMLYGWDPGSNIVDTSYHHLGFNTSDNAARTYGMERYEVGDETTRDTKVCESIDSGIPVLVLDGRCEPEWSVILGYEITDQGTCFFGRSYFDANAPAEELFTDNQYTLFNHYPGCGPKLYRPCQPIDPLDALKCSLETCLAMFKPHEKFGYGAYNKMIESFENNRFVSDWNGDGEIECILYTLTDARRAASIYLHDNAPLLTGENQKRMEMTASLYREMFGVLETIINDKSFNSHLIRNQAETRKRFADGLRKCLELERQVRDLVQKILDHWGE